MVEDALVRLEAVCAQVARPDHFTNHPHCDECFEADQFFRGHTAASLANVEDPPETLPLAFLTEQAFRYMLPALVRILARDPGASDVLILIENKLDILQAGETAALRDALYELYESRQADFHDGFCSYETLWRILDRLDTRMRTGLPFMH